MNFYIASSFNNSDMVRKLSQALELEGQKQLYDWTQNNRAHTMELLASIGKQEKEAVSNSDFFILILPGGKGSHTEFGIALALHKRIYIYSSTNDLYDFDKTTTFYHLDHVNKFVGTFEAFTEYIIKQEIKSKTTISSKI
ncbi:nucleoside 2-deoxyribosyltransferase [Niallia sp. JL1B1071]|uniref:nucleoside 2-deoxyribosyltransferase n=1 Tax=Niallia tiangongensis TaxID=3237105 RepID=UPI0037DC25D5